MYVDNGVQVITDGTKWEDLDFSKPSRYAPDVVRCDWCFNFFTASKIEPHNEECEYQETKSANTMS